MSSNMHFFGSFDLSDYSSESRMANCAFMESPSHQLYPSFPKFGQFATQEASPKTFLEGSTQSYDTFNACQDSTTQNYFNDQIGFYGSSSFMSSDLLEPPMHQPEMTQPPSVLDTKKAKGRKKNVESKGGVNRGRREKVTIRRRWSESEDRLLMQLVEQYGIKKWARIAENFPLRIGKQCRDRWHNCLNPNIVKNTWSEEDDKLLISLHKQHGNKWADIARSMPGRCENSIKNHFNATKRNPFKLSSNSHITKYQSYLLKSYITSVSLSSSDNQINTQENLGFDPQNHESAMSLNTGSSCFPGFGLGYEPDELVVNKTDFDFHEDSSHLFDQLQFDPQNDTDMMGSLCGFGFR